MPPQLATLICLFFIGYLFWVDRRKIDGVSGAVWIPFLWMFFAGSRFASQWLELGPPEGASVQAYSDGSPLDRNVFLALILAGVWVLVQRKVNWAEAFVKNKWVFLFFAYAALSVLWSDDPFLAFKRWVKGLGNVVMALVLLTERRPVEALGLVLRRLAFVLVPLSVLFIRYYPDIGRSYHMGAPMFTGVTFQKNSLGQLCLVLAIYLCWSRMFQGLRRESVPAKGQGTVESIMLLLLAWLLYVSDSATAIGLTGLVVGFLLFARLPYFKTKPQRVFSIGVTGAILVAVLEEVLGIKDTFIRMLGREPDLTGRADIWEMVVDLVPHPLIGTGYESFWAGARLAEIWARMGFAAGGIVQAHNGYVDLYLNLGILGLVLLSISIVSGLLKARRQLQTEYGDAILRISFIIAALVYNYTEAAYKPVSNVFILLLFSILEIKGSKPLPDRTRSRIASAARPSYAGGNDNRAPR